MQRARGTHEFALDWARRRVADLQRYAAGTIGDRCRVRSSGLVIAAALLVACYSGPANPTSIDASEPVQTQAEQIAEAMRQLPLIGEEMASIEGPSVLARVQRGGESLLVASPGAISGPGFFSIEAQLDDGKPVTVYVPDDVVVLDGVAIYVVAGQHGYYFRSFVSDRQQ